MNSLRMEKAFPGAGELTNEVTLPEAGVGRFYRLDKDYLGVEATRASAEAAEKGELPWICAYLEIEPDGVEDGHGGEAILVDGKVVGSTASVVYGHTVGKILAFAYVKPHAAKPGTELEVIVAGHSRKGRMLGEAAYDPASERPRTDAPQPQPA
jgi:dimethylglycine dehydrogenase